jgi:exosome complex RNA-binding protein Csl4
MPLGSRRSDAASQKSDTASQKSSLKSSLKGTLKRKASKIIKAVLPNKKKKKKPNGDALSLSSVEEPTGDMHSSGNNSHEATQPEVIDINDDSASASEESIEEDPEAELGILS